MDELRISCRRFPTSRNHLKFIIWRYIKRHTHFRSDGKKPRHIFKCFIYILNFTKKKSLLICWESLAAKHCDLRDPTFRSLRYFLDRFQKSYDFFSQENRLFNIFFHIFLVFLASNFLTHHPSLVQFIGQAKNKNHVSCLHLAPRFARCFAGGLSVVKGAGEPEIFSPWA